MEPEIMKNPSKMRSKYRCEKMIEKMINMIQGPRAGICRRRQRHIQINKINKDNA